MYRVVVKEIFFSFSFASIFLSYAVHAANPYISWHYPNWSPASPTLNYVDTLNASWTSNYPIPYLVRWCSGDSFQTFSQCSNDSVQSNGHLAVNMSSSSNDPNCRPNFLGCHFELYSPNDSNYGSNSDRWFVTENAAAQPVTWDVTNATSSGGSTSANPGTSVTTTVSGAPVTITGTPTGQTQSSSVSSSPSPIPAPAGLSTGAKAGIGVGVVAGVILLAAFAFAFYWFQRRKLAHKKDAVGKNSLNALGLHEMPDDAKLHKLQGTKHSHHALGVHELQDISKPQEMQGTAVGERGGEARLYELGQTERRGEE